MREREGERGREGEERRKEARKEQREGGRAYCVALVCCPFVHCPCPVSGYHNNITDLRI